MHPPVPRHLVQPSPILDYVWYPTAAVRDPASFCFVASVRECPVKLLDASDGRASIYYLPPGYFQRADSSFVPQLRASYRIVDHRERQVAPHSVAFNVGANRCVDPGSEPRFRILTYVTRAFVASGFIADSRTQ